MKNIKIIARTDKGKIALEKHIAESFKLSRQEKLTFRMLGFSQKVTSQEPLTLELSMNNKMSQLVHAADFISKISESLRENGAIDNIDYFTEVE